MEFTKAIWDPHPEIIRPHLPMDIKWFNKVNTKKAT